MDGKSSISRPAYIKHLPAVEKKLHWLYPLLALLIYWPTRKAGFVHDFTGWFERYQTYDWEGIFHCFGYHRLQHVMHFLHFLIYKAFGTAPLPWYFIYSVLFGFNAYLVFRLAKELLTFFDSNDRYLPVLSSFLFLIHPYQTTAVVWKVCFHYLLATFFVLFLLRLTLEWVAHPTKRKLTLILLGYVISFFVHELTICIPLITIVIIGVLSLKGDKRIRQVVLTLLLPQLLFIPIYFSLTPHLLLDTGKDALLTEHTIDIKKQTSAVLQYGSKHVLFTRYWSHPAKEKWQNNLSKTLIVISSLFFGFILLILFVIYHKKIPPLLKIAAFSFLVFAAAIGPFSSAYVSYILYATNDMYGFAASAFIIIMTVALIRSLPWRISQVLVILYTFLSLVFLVRTIYYWHESGLVMNRLLEDFRWYDKKKVYVLAGPDNFQGTLMTKSTEVSMLDDHLLVKNGVRPYCEIEDIVQFNMTKRTDGVSVQVHSQDSLSVKFNQWGTWHWRHGIGASSYENEKFNVNLSIPYFHLKRKSIEPDAVFIYQDGDKWKEVKEWQKQY